MLSFVSFGQPKVGANKQAESVARKEALKQHNLAVRKKKWYDTIRVAYTHYRQAAKLYEQIGYWGKASQEYYDLGLCFKRTSNKAGIISQKDSASKYYELALDIAARYPDSTLDFEHKLLAEQGNFAKSRRNYDQADSFYTKAIEKWKQIPDRSSSFILPVLYSRFFIYRTQNRFDLCKSVLEQFDEFASEAHNNQYARNSLYGEYYFSLGEYEKALFYFRQRLEMAILAYGPEDKYVITTYMRIGACFELLRERNESINMYKKALDLVKVNTDYEKITFCYYKLSTLAYREKEYEQSLAYAINALPFVSKLTPEGQIAAFQRIPLIYSYLNKPDSAVYYLSVLKQKIAKTSQSERRGQVNRSAGMYSIAEYYQKTLELDSAKIYAEKAYAEIAEMPGRQSAKSSRLMRISSVEFEMGNYEACLDFQYKSLSLYQTEPGNICGDSSYIKVSDAWSALSGAVDMHWKVYEKTKKTDLLEKVICLGEANLSIYESIIQLVPSENSRAQFKEKLKNVAEHINRATAALSSLESASKIDHVLSLNDKIKVYDLRWKLASGLATKTEYGVPDSIKDEIASYKVLIKKHEANLAREAKRQAQSKLKSELSLARLKLTALYTSVKTEYPNFYNFIFNAPEYSDSELDDILQKDDCLLSYFMGSEMAYVFVKSKEKTELIELGNSISLRASIDSFLIAIQNTDLKNTHELAYSLYQNLIPEFARHCGRIIIVPDERIYLIPFDALVTNPYDGKSTPEFAIRQHEFCTSFSISYMLNSYGKKKKEFEYDYFGLALNFRNASSKEDLPFLQNAEAEVNNASSNFKQSTTFFANEATEGTFCELAQKSRIIHLATHALSNELNPLLSRLVLEPDEEHDGSVFMHELLNLSIPSELVILSACNTGTGRVTSNDGIISLGYGFAYAGCENSVMSLWSSPDESTSKIIDSYSRLVANGKNYSEALRLAKLEYLENADAIGASPYYWGGLAFIGIPETSSSSSFGMWILILSLGLILIVVFLLKKRRSSKFQIR